MVLYFNGVPERVLEIILVLANAILAYLGIQHTFPKRFCTVVNNGKFKSAFYTGLTEYAICRVCHQVYKPKSSTAVECCTVPLYKKPSSMDLPFKVFPYNSVITTIKKFFLRPGFVGQITQWTKRNVPEGKYMDIYDGSVFKNFKLDPADSVPFTSESVYNLMLTLNVDWYSIYNNSSNSCGSIYLTIQNLPKAGARDLKKNIILVGIIPGPKEPNVVEMSNYLELLAEELLVLKDGVPMEMVMPDKTVATNVVKAALTLVCCDLPATKKVSGFVAHTGYYGCHRCKVSFKGDDTKRDWSGPFLDKRLLRTKKTTDAEAQVWKNAPNTATRDELVKTNGTRWTPLHRLPYFDAAGFTVVEPMHNLFLGTVRHLVDLWLKDEGLSQAKLKEMESFFAPSNFLVPSESAFGSIPRKIAIGQGFSYFKASEWKNWCISMAPLKLREYIPARKYANFMKLRGIICKLDNPDITSEGIKQVHQEIEEFGQDFEDVYGKDKVKPNQHMHLHIAECMEMYGPVSCFWAFGFERYNMFVKNIKTNHKDGVEKTLMKRMLHQIFEDDYFRHIRHA